MITGKDCTSCGLCKFVCKKHNAIDCFYDELGNRLYRINHEKCIRCGACSKLCPNNTSILKNDLQKDYYIAFARDGQTKELELSSSGGIAYLISKRFIENGGIVFGAAWCNNYVKHVCVRHVEDLVKLQGSKYVDSDITSIFEEISNEKEKAILFIGTPCQTAAIKHFFGFRKNIYLIDLICHGTPSMKLLNEEIKDDTSSHVSRIYFRRNGKYIFELHDDTKLVFKELASSNAYESLFLSGITFKNACYNCLYAEKRRVGDLTLGDDNTNSFDARSSSVVINSDKGSQLFSLIDGLVHAEKRDIETLCSTNPQFSHPFAMPSKREKFIKYYIKYGLKKGLYKTYKFTRIKTFFRNLIHGGDI